MAEKNSSQFKIGMEGESPDTLLDSEYADRRIDKLSQRMTVFSVLIPCIVCILIVIAYFDMKKRFMIVQGSGEKEVKNLSANIESSYASLSVQFAKLQETVDTGMSELKKQSASFKKDLDSTGKSIRALSASKATKKELKGFIAETGKNFKSLNGSMKDLEDNLSASLKSLSETVNASQLELEKIKDNFSAMASSMIDRKEIEIALKAERQSVQEKLDDLSKVYSKKLAMAQIKMKELEKRLNAIEEKQPAKTVAPVTEAPAAAESPAVPTVPEKAGDKPASEPTPGNIIEQDIQ